MFCMRSALSDLPRISYLDLFVFVLGLKTHLYLYFSVLRGQGISEDTKNDFLILPLVTSPSLFFDISLIFYLSLEVVA